jgi:glycosyltransferase involved in cell wall biosynthesis
MTKLFIVSTEPAPYKTDLYNAFCELPDWDVYVFYALIKSWEPDASHNFTKFPVQKYKASYHHGKGFRGQFNSAYNVIRLLRNTPDFLIVCTLNRLPFIIAVLYAVIKRIPFALWDDHFNVGSPNIKFIFTKAIRSFVRWLVFRFSRAVLICGNYGWATAIEVGCPEDKLVNFPYAVDHHRLKFLANETDSFIDLKDKIKNRVVILFSGRMIERKGLEILLMASSQLLKEGEDFFLIIEGDGPLKHRYEKMADELNLNDNVIFVGFSQMDRHAYLLSVSDIVVVPSTEEPWGIVVHEGMLMGKAVCASDAVCAARDRIQHGINGILFPSGDWSTLVNELKTLLHDREMRLALGNKAKDTAEYWSPKKNVDALLAHLKQKNNVL